MKSNNRDEKRLKIHNMMLIELQLFGTAYTYETFVGDFKYRIKKETGECTDEDIAWVKEHLDCFLEHIAEEKGLKLED